jgi:hypothetical protein
MILNDTKMILKCYYIIIIKVYNVNNSVHKNIVIMII